MPQGVAVSLVNMRFKKQPQIRVVRVSASWTRNIQADRNVFFYLDWQVVFKRCLTNPAIIIAVTDSDPHVENLAGGI